MTSSYTDTAPASAPDFSGSPARIAGLVVALTAVLGILLLAFTLPMIHSAPHEVPLGVVGPAEVVEQLKLRLAVDDAFEVTVAATMEDAREMILHREIDGAVVIGDGSVTTLYATAASPAVAQLVQATGSGLATQLGVTHDSEDVRSFTTDDPGGIGLAAGALPLALGGWAGAIVIMLVIRRPAQQLIAISAFSVLGGVALTSLLFAVGTFEHNFGPACAAGVLGIAATAFGIVGLRSAFGKAGIVIAVIAIILLGNPLSGLSSSPQLIPAPWGALGQMLPPGATGTLLRNVVFFDGHAIAGPIMVLSAWLIGGLTLWAIAAWRQAVKRRREATTE